MIEILILALIIKLKSNSDMLFFKQPLNNYLIRCLRCTPPRFHMIMYN